ncbi:MAG: hypothetical protein MJ252_22535 [archaeon]|nr:hypothetical protein [archaeon]
MSFEYKFTPIKLVSYNEDGLIETTEDGVEYLSSLANQNISILTVCSPNGVDRSNIIKSFLRPEDNFVSQPGGIYVWGTPIALENNSKLLILDLESLEENKTVSKKLFLISVLMSTCVIFTSEEIKEETLKLLSEHINFSSKISIEENKKNDLETLGEEYFPPLIWAVNNFSSEKEGNIYLEESLNKDHNLTNELKALFQKRKCFLLGNTSLKEISEEIKEKIKSKKIKNFNIDGESLFGVTQNYIDALNNDENPIIQKALENVLLSKGKNISEQIFSEFKADLYSNLKDKYPLPFTEIFKVMFDLCEKYFPKFSKEVESTLTVPQSGDYLIKISQMAQNELENVFDLNKDYYEEWYGVQYKELEENIQKIDSEILFENLRSFFDRYFGEVQNTLTKFAEIPNPEYMKIMISVLSKIIQEFVFEKVKKVSEDLNEKYQNEKKESNAKIEELNTQIKKLTDQISSDKKTLESKLNEKSEINRALSELQNKNDKLMRELKAKEKDNENNIIIGNQKYNKMEAYYKNQIAEKDNNVSQLEAKIEKLNKDISDSNRENTNKISELNRENLKLQFEIERLKGQEKKGKNDFDCGSVNIQTLFKNIQSTFMEFKESIDKLDRENDNIFKAKFLEHSSKEIENKSKSWLDEIKNFKESQIKSLNDNYEKTIKKTKEEVEELTFEINKKDYSLQEVTQLKDNYMNKFKEVELKLNQNTDLQNAKDGIINTQNENIKILEGQLESTKNYKEELEIKLNAAIVENKVKDDEMETLISVIDAMSQKKKEKYEHVVSRLSDEIKCQVEKVVKGGKLFK